MTVNTAVSGILKVDIHAKWTQHVPNDTARTFSERIFAHQGLHLITA
ncbi:hypothetical protein EVA_15388 [gut metagenome]|uniref:Uncharacterized protein n=1 Tax=gut metagenome TaxID=749906 RepID=J9GAQ2_9ZZZZ